MYNYHLVKNMNIDFRKVVTANIEKQWMKWAKDMVMGYTNKSFVKLMDWLYVQYGHITPGDLVRNQEEMQATYRVDDPTNILFEQI